MTAMVLHQSYMTQQPSVYTVQLHATVFSFTLMFTDGWFTQRAMGFC